MLNDAVMLKVYINDPQLLPIHRLKQSSVLTTTFNHPIPGIQASSHMAQPSPHRMLFSCFQKTLPTILDNIKHMFQRSIHHVSSKKIMNLKPSRYKPPTNANSMYFRMDEGGSTCDQGRPVTGLIPTAIQSQIFDMPSTRNCTSSSICG